MAEDKPISNATLDALDAAAADVLKRGSAFAAVAMTKDEIRTVRAIVAELKAYRAARPRIDFAYRAMYGDYVSDALDELPPLPPEEN